MCWSEQRTYPGERSSPGVARRFTVARLREVLGDDPGARPAIDDAALAISELVTNAVNAHATTITVELSLHRDHLRLAVSDDADGQPEMRSPSMNATGGRGLHIIEQLTRHWGSRTQGNRKEIWAELPLDPATTAALDCAR